MVKKKETTDKAPIITNPNGAKYGRLLILREIEPVIYPYGSYKRVECICDCGNTVKVRLSKVLTGLTKSCGCIKREKLVSRNQKHGGRKDVLYVVWSGMKQRCNYNKYHAYHRYGGRGIKISTDWLDYSSFRRDMEKSYRAGLTLDRINNDGDYCKENCRWVSPKEQANNRSKKHVERKLLKSTHIG